MNVEINPLWMDKDGDSKEEKFKKFYDKTRFLYETMKKKAEYAFNFIDKECNISE